MSGNVFDLEEWLLDVCLKELKESRRWLRLCLRVPLIMAPAENEALLSETEELI